MDRVERTIEIDAPVERVWSILTEPDAIAQWYAFDGAEVDLRVGGALRFCWKEHGVFHGRVLRVEREQHARFSEEAWTVALDAVRRIGTEPAQQREEP